MMTLETLGVLVLFGLILGGIMSRFPSLMNGIEYSGEVR